MHIRGFPRIIGRGEKDSKSPLIEPSGAQSATMASSFVGDHMGSSFDGGFKIQAVTSTKGTNLEYTINQTMMRLNLVQPLAPGGTHSF